MLGTPFSWSEWHGQFPEKTAHLLRVLRHDKPAVEGGGGKGGGGETQEEITKRVMPKCSWQTEVQRVGKGTTNIILPLHTVSGKGHTQILGGTVSLRFGNRWKSSSVRKGMNGARSRRPVSKQVYLADKVQHKVMTFHESQAMLLNDTNSCLQCHSPYLVLCNNATSTAYMHSRSTLK